MRHGFAFASLPLLATIALGCGTRAQPDTLHDTSGASFAFSCSGATCSITPASGPPALPQCPSGSSAAFATGSGRILTICGACGSADTSPPMCRPASCEGDLDCPYFAHTFHCFNGVCQLDAHDTTPISVTDATAMCLATTPRATTASAAANDQAVKTAETEVGMSCPKGARCTVPSKCRQP